ncbi:MAG: DivIVA domain-containing protein [Deltaproteobacteria bacterium]|jgi:cell division initiation protein|nr:DivIVA domain-containing protein [Deltaproteobacteria bacterium]MDA8305649.1 DivIVA domain-containing protein [Deltaproteobacteria bacterium]
MEIDEIEEKRFRKRLMGFDPGDVEPFVRDLTDELGRLKEENENLKKDIQTLDAALKEHRDREKTIRAVLISAQKSAEQIKANAEREAKLIVSEAEVKAEGILKEANNRIIRMEQEISEMRRNRIQFGARMRSLLDSFRQILDDDGKEAPQKFEEKQDNSEQP